MRQNYLDLAELADLEIFAALPNNLWQLLVRDCQLFYLKSGDGLAGLRRAEPMVCFMISGAMVVARTAQEISASTVYRYVLKDEPLLIDPSGLCAGSGDRVTAIAETEIIVISQGLHDVLLAEAPQFTRHILRCKGAVADGLADRLCDRRFYSLRYRLGHELLQLLPNLHGESDYAGVLPTQELIASLLGTHREAVSREMKQFEREKLIIRQGRHIHIPSPDAFRASLA